MQLAEFGSVGLLGAWGAVSSQWTAAGHATRLRPPQVNIGERSGPRNEQCSGNNVVDEERVSVVERRGAGYRKRWSSTHCDID